MLKYNIFTHFSPILTSTHPYYNICLCTYITKSVCRRFKLYNWYKACHQSSPEAAWTRWHCGRSDTCSVVACYPGNPSHPDSPSSRTATAQSENDSVLQVTNTYGTYCIYFTFLFHYLTWMSLHVISMSEIKFPYSLFLVSHWK